MTMENVPLVSIIIPCYNAEAFVLETLRSCLNQTYGNLEVIAVDDHSTDRTAQLVSTFFEEHPIGQLVSNPQKGAQHARNFGMELARGEFLKFLDADDLISRDLVAKQVACIHPCAGALVKCSWEHFREFPGDVPGKPQPCDRSFDAPDLFLTELWAGNMYMPHCWLIPRPLLQRWDPALTQNQDGEYFARLVASSQQILHSNGTAFYRQPAGTNTSQRTGIEHLKSQFLALQTYRSICEQFGSPASLVSAYHHEVFNVAYRAAIQPSERELLPEALSFFEPGQALLLAKQGTAMKVLITAFGVKTALRIRSLF